MYGLLPICLICRDVVDSDPHMLAKAMRMSQNAEVREYGCRLELALERQKKRRGGEPPRTGQGDEGCT